MAYFNVLYDYKRMADSNFVKSLCLNRLSKTLKYILSLGWEIYTIVQSWQSDYYLTNQLILSIYASYYKGMMIECDVNCIKYLQPVGRLQ